MSNSSQNNKRASEMSSFAVAEVLLDRMNGALGTAVHVLVAAAHRTAFTDDSQEAPCSPMCRIAKASFVLTFMTYNTIAIVNGHDEQAYRPPTSSYQHTCALHGYTAATRWATMLALPSLVGVFQLQRVDHEADPDQQAPRAVPQQLGYQQCESLFSTWRSATGQNTGAISCLDVLNKADAALAVAGMHAKGTFTLPESRKADRKHKLHPNGSYSESITGMDINMSIHLGETMCTDMLKNLGYDGVLEKHSTLQSAMQEMLLLSMPQSPVCSRVQSH